MHLTLPQFKDERCHCTPTMDGPCCKMCRAPGSVAAAWRLEQTGRADFPCPMAGVSAVQAKTAPAPAVKVGDTLVVSPPTAEHSLRGARWRGERKAPLKCPHGKPWGYRMDVDNLAPMTPAATPTISNIASLLKTWTTGERVPDEVAAERKAICAGCQYRKVADAGAYCAAPGGCGCTVEPRKVAFLTIGMADITRWQEKPGKRLCAHPKRGKGGGWLR